MDSLFRKRIITFLIAQKKKKRWQRVVEYMAAVVVFVTTYMLILPAITMTKDTVCGLEAHTHTEACYNTVAASKILSCSMDDLDIHEHLEICYNDAKELICGCADYIVHEHTEDCYDSVGSRVCTLPEIKEHEHEDSCYKLGDILVCEQNEDEAHIHSTECYTRQRLGLTCLELEHSHQAECYDEDGNLVCTMKEHAHTDICYYCEDILTCSLIEERGHIHTEECYKTLVCGEEEIICHEHKDECYEVVNDQKVLVCEQIVVKKHVHTDSCFETTEASKTKICELEEHEHIDECYQSEEQEVIEDTVLDTEEDTDSTAVYMDGSSGCVVVSVTPVAWEEVPRTITFARTSPETETALMTAEDEVAVTGTAIDFGNYITDAKVEKLDGNTWVEETEFKNGDHIKVSLTFDIPANILTTDNNTIQYQLPGGISIENEEVGIAYKDGVAIGTYTITTSGLITITYYDSFATGAAFTGIIYFEGSVTSNGAGQNGEITFGGDGGTITVEPEKTTYDMSISKNASFDKENKTAAYSVTVSTTKGTDPEDTITITDQFGTYNPTAEAVYDTSSIKVYKVSNGSKTQVSSDNYTLTTTEDGFEITGLAALEAGEQYIVEYTVKDITTTENSKDGSSSLTNYAKAQSGDNTPQTSKTIEVTKKSIAKSGSYDSSTGMITWRITINEEGKDISGLTFTDILPENVDLSLLKEDSEGKYVELVSGNTVLKAYVSSDGRQITYRFPEETSDTNTYTITYQTKAPDTENGEQSVTNTVQFDGKSVDGVVSVPKRELKVEKRWANQTKISEEIYIYYWNTTMNFPSSGITEDGYTYIDTLQNAAYVNEDGETVIVEDSHYAILKDLKEALEENLKITTTSGTLTYADPQNAVITITYYGSDGEEVTEDDAKVTSFAINIKAKEGTTIDALQMSILQYPTIVDVSAAEPGVKWTIANTGEVGDKESEASHNYEKPSPLRKMILYDNPYNSTNYFYEELFWSSGDVYLDYDTGFLYDSGTGKHILTYKILINRDDITLEDLENEYAVVLEDTLPEGVKLKEDSLYVFPSDLSGKYQWYNIANTDYYVGGNDQSYNESQHYNIAVEYDEATGSLSIKFRSIDSKSEDSIIQDKLDGEDISNKPICILYQVEIDDLFLDATLEELDLINTVVWDGHDTVSQKTTVAKEYEKVYKTGNVNASVGGGIVTYDVIVNAKGENLTPATDTIILKDTMSVSNAEDSYLNLENVHLYHYDATQEDGKGALVDSSLYKLEYDEETHEMIFTLPDEMPLILSYSYTVVLGSYDSATATNRVELNGVFESSETTVIETQDSGSSALQQVVKLYKVDSQNYQITEGAVFTLYRYNASDSTSEILSEEYHLDLTNNEWGPEANEDNKKLTYDTLYWLEETKPPGGYQLSEEKFYFIFLKDGKTEDEAYSTSGAAELGVSKEDIEFIGSGGGTLLIPNDYNRVSVKKVWLDSKGNEIEGDIGGVSVQLKRYTSEEIAEDGYKVTLESFLPYQEDAVDSINVIVAKEGNVTLTFNGLYKTYTIKISGKEYKSISTADGLAKSEVITITKEDTSIEIYAGYGDLSFGTGEIAYVVDKPNTLFIGDGEIIENVTLNSGNGWSYAWDDLPHSYTDENGDNQLYYYVIEETNVPDGYLVSYSNNGVTTGSITVVNRKEESKYELPETGGPGTNVYTAGGLLLLFAAVLLYIKLKNQKKGGCYSTGS